MVVAEDAGLGKDVERALRSLDVQLVARRAIEGTGRIRADLGRDTQLREKLERTTGSRGGRQVEVERDRASPSQMHRAGRVEERGDLRQAVATAGGRDRRELRADVLGQRARAQSSTPSSASRRRLSSGPALPYPPIPFAATTRWHGMISE